MRHLSHDSIRTAPYGAGLALLLSVAIASGGCSTMAGDGAEVTGRDPEVTPAAAPLRVHVSTTLADASIRLSMELDEDGDRMTGTRTVTYDDGTVEEEPFEYSLRELQASGTVTPAEGGGYTLPGLDDLELELVDAESFEHGALYVFRAPGGEELVVELEGDVGYVPPLVIGAGVVLGSIGVVALIALCGWLTYRHIKKCSEQNKCWSFGSWGLVCTGKCQAC